MAKKCNAVNCQFTDPNSVFFIKGSRIIHIDEDNLDLCREHAEIANGKWRKGKKPQPFLIRRPGETKDYLYRRGSTRKSANVTQPKEW